MSNPLIALFKIAVLAISTLGVVGFVEVGLRLFPALIPIGLLESFPRELRAGNARARQLPTLEDTASLARDDGGPPLRLFKPFTTVTYDFDDPEIVHTVTMDEMGFCNPLTHRYDLNEIDIISIGDSHTWCTTVHPDDTWTSHLSVLTGRSAYNLARPGIGIYEYLQILKQFGLAKSPDVVILNLAETNDLRDAIIYQRYRQDDGGAVLQTSAQHMLTRLKESFIGRHSYVFNMALITARRLRSAAAPTEAVDFRYRITVAGREVSFNPQNTDIDEVLHARGLRSGRIALDAFTEGLRAFVELSRAHRFVPIVTYTPSPHTAYVRSVVFDDPTLAELLPWFSLQQREYFASKAHELGYVFVDPTPEFQAAADGQASERLLYYASNLHMTRHGHRVLATALDRALLAAGKAEAATTSNRPN